MNLKNQSKESTYVKIILLHLLPPYKSATRNNRAAVTCFQIDMTTHFKFLNGIIFRSGVARFAPQFGNWNSIYHKFRQ